MAIVEYRGSKITYKYLMNKTKSDLAREYLILLDDFNKQKKLADHWRLKYVKQKQIAIKLSAVIVKGLMLSKKFANKVQTGQARSKEIYADCKEFIETARSAPLTTKEKGEENNDRKGESKNGQGKK